MMLLPSAGARADGREEGPIEIEKCQTIDKPGSYKLVNNLFAIRSFPGGGTCLVITADFVTIDLAGFLIGTEFVRAIVAAPSSGQLQGINIRNGAISGTTGDSDVNFVDLTSADGSVVEGLRLRGGFPTPVSSTPANAIAANGIVRGNTVLNFIGGGIVATGIVTGNYLADNLEGIDAGAGSTVIGNTVIGRPLFKGVGIHAVCPSNVSDNTTLNNAGGNLVLDGTGCNNSNNVAP
jgi:hypothetical protein